ncbi:MAG: GntR family transcriptional regulator, partial [Planctomycetota bacterium]
MWIDAVSPSSPLPKVQQLEKAVRHAIETGSLAKGSKLPGLRTVARQTGVSVGMVKQAMETLANAGYLVASPRRGFFVASSRPSRKDIVLVLPMLENEMMLRVVGTLRIVLQDENRRLVVQAAAADWEDEAHLIEYLHPKLVHGVILLPPPRTSFVEALRELEHRKLPTVQMGFGLSGLGFDAVLLDGFETGRIAMQYLLGRGHRKIGFVDTDGDSDTQQEIRAGLDFARRQHGSAELHRIEASPSLSADRPWSNGETATVRLLKQHPKLTAIIGHDPHVTIGVHRGVSESGRDVGTRDGVSVLSLGGDLSTFEVLRPAVTTLDLPMQAMATQAVQRLLARIEAEEHDGPSMPAGRVTLP